MRLVMTNRENRESRVEDGFTLIELLIVIVVLGVLSAVVIFAMGSVTANAQATACIADAKTVETAVGVYNTSNSTPIGLETGITPGTPVTVGAVTGYAQGTQAVLLLATGDLNAWPLASNGYSMSLSTAAAGG